MMLYILIVVGTMAISLWAVAHLKGIYNRYSQVPAASGITGAEAAARILDRAGIHDVEIVAQNGDLVDHYDPINKRLVLSTRNYAGHSLAAVGVAAHECGHAIQHKLAYAPLQWRMMAIGVTNIASQIVMWLPIIGMATAMFTPQTAVAIMAVGWGIIMLFNLITLPVEFDASRRAKVVLGGMGFVQDGEEAEGVRKTLDAAALTYVAAFITSLAYFLYFLMRLFMTRNEE
jgi:Zn-dependent membrane protease YugP